MQRSVAIFLLAGLAQAALLSQVQDKTTQEDAAEDLMIKMPEAIDIIKAGEKPRASLALVQADTTQQVGMFESGVLHASLKPIVKAKVNKVISFIHKTKDEYQHGTEDQKKAIQDKATSLIMQGMGTRAYNLALCEELWSEYTEIAGVLSFYFCPALIFPATNLAGAPPLSTVKGEGASRLRSAFLTEYFWKSMLSNNKKAVIDFLSDDVTYYWGASTGLVGKKQVSQVLPYIGFPEGSKLSNPVEWHCDTTTCIAPVKAWAEHMNYCLLTFGAGGDVTEAIVPLSLWR